MFFPGSPCCLFSSGRRLLLSLLRQHALGVGEVQRQDIFSLCAPWAGQKNAEGGLLTFVHEAKASFLVEKLDVSLHRGSPKMLDRRDYRVFRGSTSPDFARWPAVGAGAAVLETLCSGQTAYEGISSRRSGSQLPLGT
jgi:hypothetical protein